MEKESLTDHVSDVYHVDNKRVEHSCCWESAIVQRVTDKAGDYRDGLRLVCECDPELAQPVCDFLNSRLNGTNATPPISTG